MMVQLYYEYIHPLYSSLFVCIFLYSVLFVNNQKVFSETSDVRIRDNIAIRAHKYI